MVPRTAAQEAGLAGQPAGLAGGHLLPGAGLGDPGGGQVGDQGVVVDQHDQGGGLAAVAGQVGFEDPFEEGDERDALLAGQGQLGELASDPDAADVRAGRAGGGGGGR